MTNNIITLIETEKDDLNAFFQFQLDEEASYLAAFIPKESKTKLLTLKNIQSTWLTPPYICGR